MKSIIHLSILFLASCNMENNSDDILKSLPIEVYDENCEILIIPLIGCAGCINSSINFIENNSSSTIFHVVFTNIGSLKSAKLLVGEKILRQDNIYFDYKNNLTKRGFISNYPLLLKYKNYVLVQVDTLDGNYYQKVIGQ